MPVPPHTIVDEGSELLWSQFADNIRIMKWTSHDNLILGLIPSLASTKCVFARNDDDGSFLGCIVWNEFDEMAWIGSRARETIPPSLHFTNSLVNLTGARVCEIKIRRYHFSAAHRMYLCVPEVRGSGVGSSIWARAMERIRPTGLAIGLRGVPEMAAKYVASGMPFEHSRLRFNIMSCTELRQLCGKLRKTPSVSDIRLKSQLSDAQIEELCEFDEQMTGRDRRDVLLPFLASPLFDCAVLLDDKGRIAAWAGLTSDGLEKERLFKLAPVYASSLSQFAELTVALLPFCESVYADANIVIHILSGTVGERELEPLLSNPQNIERVTLFSKPIDWKLKKHLCYSPHNSCCHFDG